MDEVSTLTGIYDYRLVLLSISISILAAYAALDLAERVTTSKDGARAAWLYGGATAMGFGIWTMHYVGMVAFQLPIPVFYDWPTVAASLLAAVVASGVALFVVSRQTMGFARTALGSLIMGIAIAGMHYIGMEAMRIQAMCVYSASVVVLSVILAVVISFVAIELAFAGRYSQTLWNKRKLWSGLVMGLAIPVMHYVGMAAVKFVPEPGFNGNLSHSTSITPLGLGTIVAATFIMLLHVEIISKVNRQFARQAEQLAESARQLKVVFDSLVEGIAVLDIRRAMVRMNPAAQRIFGMPSEEMPLQQAQSLLQMSTLEGDLLSFNQWPGNRVQRGEFQQNSEVVVHSTNIEQPRVVELTSAPIVNQAGECVQVVFTCRDVTERKRADDARARLVAIVQSSQDGIIGKDLKGIVTSWNKGAEVIFGYKAEEMIGKSIQRLLPPGLAGEEDSILERLRRGEMVEHLETTRQRKDGQRIDVSLMISPIRDSKDRIIGASKIVRDITENRLLERQLRQSRKMEAIGQLTGGIAHDFNNLLAIVIGNLGLLERMLAGNEPAMKRLLPAQKASARGADLTRRLLALASKQDLNPVNLRLEDAIHETIELASRVLGPEIKIVVDMDSSLPPAFVDSAGLGSALLNLAVNARDAMPKGGTLTISTQLAMLDDSFPGVQTGELKVANYARISVADTGHGMSKETLERALEPFFTTKPRGKGTGLGLAMVYAFAKQSGGTVRLYSEEGYGTIVSIYLPLASEFTLSQPVEMPRPVPIKRCGTVLVVDDEAELLEIAHTYLIEMGYTVICADGPAAAMTALAEHEDIDLMVTDIIMPGGMNGAELAEAATQLNRNLKVIYSSGFPADALADMNGTKVDGPMLRKPYHRAEFTSMVQRAMEAGNG